MYSLNTDSKFCNYAQCKKNVKKKIKYEYILVHEYYYKYNYEIITIYWYIIILFNWTFIESKKEQCKRNRTYKKSLCSSKNRLCYDKLNIMNNYLFTKSQFALCKYKYIHYNNLTLYDKHVVNVLWDDKMFDYFFEIVMFILYMGCTSSYSSKIF